MVHNFTSSRLLDAEDTAMDADAIIGCSSVTTAVSRSKNTVNSNAPQREAAKTEAATEAPKPPHATGQPAPEVIDLLSSSDEEQEHAGNVVPTAAVAPSHYEKQPEPMTRARPRTLIRGGGGVSRDVSAASTTTTTTPGMTHALSIVHDGAAGNENPSQSISIVVSVPFSHTADNTASLQGPANSACTYCNDSTSDQALALAAAAIAKVFQAIRADPPSRPCVAYRDSSSAGSSNGPATASTTTVEPMSTMEAPPTNVLPPKDVEMEQDQESDPPWNDVAANLRDHNAIERLGKGRSTTNNPDVNGKRSWFWTPEEDQILTEKLALYGRKWTKIASHLPGRQGAQCRERYVNRLNPELTKGKWTDDEEAMLIALHQHHGTRWATISKQLPGRCDSDVKNHWYNIMQRKFAKHGESVRLARYFSLLMEGTIVNSHVACARDCKMFGM
jgi:Myb-like DNA-binding domain